VRDQKVHLPLTVSKEAFLFDLQYFGFDVEDFPVDKQDSKQGKQPGVMIQQGSHTEFLQLLVAVEYNMDEDLKELDGSIKQHVLFKSLLRLWERKNNRYSLLASMHLSGRFGLIPRNILKLPNFRVFHVVSILKRASSGTSRANANC